MPSPPTVNTGPVEPIPSQKKLKSPTVHAASAILIDADTGQVIYEKDADTERPMASTTKIMTALLFCENVPETTVVTASKEACKIHNCSLHLKLGEKLTAHDLLRAMLIRSANDTCVVAAEQVAGSEAAFVRMMNERAAQLGATHTHFANPHGLTAPDHYTTARDLATIARTVVQQERIMEVVRLLNCDIQRSINTNDSHLHNYTHFVGKYPGAEGLKSGWTTPAGHCYVGVASRNGWRLISVVLKSPEYGSDTMALMNFGFNNFEPCRVSEAGTVYGEAPIRSGVRPTVTAQIQSPLTVVVHKGEEDRIEKRARFADTQAPITPGTPVGALEAWVDSKPLASVPLVAMARVSATPMPEQASTGSGRKVVYALGIFMTGLVSLRYGTRRRKRFTSPAKGARRSGTRFTANLRDDHLLR